MKISTEHLMSISVINFALIRITRKNNEIEYGSLKLYYDNSFKDEENAPVTGEVIAPPRALTYGPEGCFNETEMEIKKGDQVWFHYLCYINAKPGNNSAGGRYFTIEGDSAEYILVKYDQMYLAKRGEEIIPLNGHAIVEPLPAEDMWESKVLIVPEISNKIYKRSETFGTVKYLGAPVKKYKDPNIPPDDLQLKVGNVVAIEVFADIPIETELHQVLPKTYFRVLRKDILGIVEDGIKS